LAFEGIALHGVAAGIKQIGVAAEDLAVPEQNHAAALADAPIQQGDVDRIKPVLHDVPLQAAAPTEAGDHLCQNGTRSVNATGCPIRAHSETKRPVIAYVYDATRRGRVTRAKSNSPVK